MLEQYALYQSVVSLWIILDFFELHFQSERQVFILCGLFQIMENAEINNIIKIVGLQYKKNYEDQDSLKTLRYGKIMIMTDQVRFTKWKLGEEKSQHLNAEERRKYYLSPTAIVVPNCLYLFLFIILY